MLHIFRSIRIKRLTNECERLRKEKELLVSQIEEYRLLVKGSILPLSLLGHITDTPVSILSIWTTYHLLPAVNLDDTFCVSGETVLQLLTDHDGLLHIRDDYHKPLIPSDILKMAKPNPGVDSISKK